MKKKIIALCLVMMMAVMLASCGKKTEVPEKSGQQEENVSDKEESKEKKEKPDKEKKESGNSEEKKEEVAAKSSDTGSAPQIIRFKKSYYEFSNDDTYTQLLTGRFCMPLLSDESAKEYPELAKAMQADKESEYAFFESQMADYKKEAQDFFAEYPDAFYGPYEVTQDLDIKRCDDLAVSLFLPVYSFLGGAHGMYGNGYINYDTKTGKILKLSDVLTNVDSLSAVIKEELVETYGDMDDMFYDLDDSLAHYVDGEGYENGDDFYYGYVWALTDEGIEFYFGPYELAPYAAGAQSAFVNYSDHPELFDPYYFPERPAKNTMTPFSFDYNLFDLDGDGNNEDIGIEYDYNDDYSEKTGARLYIGDKKVQFEGGEDGVGYVDEVYPYIIHMTDGRFYVYILQPAPNDFVRLLVYDVTGGDIKPVEDTYYASPMIDYNDGDSSWTEYFMYDPDNMQFATRFDMICTFGASKTYHVGPDGKPQTDDEAYIVGISADYKPITSIKAFDCDEVGADGSLTPVSLNAGETFKLLSTDGETWLDAMISDGRIVRLKIKGSGMEMTVNDTPVSELFEELMFAG